MRCRECAAETSAETQFCALCEAPVARQTPEMADAAAGVISDAAGGAVQVATAQLRLAASQQDSAPATRQEPVAADSAADTVGDGAGRAAAAAAAAGADGQTPPEPYVPGCGEEIPAFIRRVRRGYSYLGCGAVFGGLAIYIVGGYFADLNNNEYDLRYLYAAIALGAGAAVLFGLRIRWSRFLRRPADAGSATVTACRRGGRTLMLYSPWDGYPSGLRVRLAWWAEPEMLLPGESVTFYGRPGGAGRLLVSSPARDRPFVGTARRRPAFPAGEQAGQDAPHQPAGQRAGRYLRWGPPTLACLAFAAAVAATVIAAASSSTSHLTEGQLRAGDCLTGSNLGLGTDNDWPNVVTVVPCTQPHEAEVFFSGNAWPESLAAYPGDDAISSQAEARCSLEFNAYDGNDIMDSSFMFDTVAPFGRSDWGSGDRQLVCVAYISHPSTPGGGLPMKYSIKGSDR